MEMISGYVAKYGLRAVTIAILCVIVAVLIAWGQITGKRKDRKASQYRDMAVAAAEQAKAAAARAQRAETSNEIARDTQGRMDNVHVTVALPAEQSAQRIEAKANDRQAVRADPEHGVDDDIVRELAEGRDAYTAAAGQLRGKKSR